MSDKYKYGEKVAEVESAAGVKGVLCKTFGKDGRSNNFFFRVYGSDGNFVDYDIYHDDLSVTIDAKELASFYTIGEDKFLDHSPSVLDLRKADKEEKNGMKLDNYHEHEALDRCHIVSRILEDTLLTHPFISANKEIEAMLIQAQSLIEDAYQKIGGMHLPNTDSDA